MNRAVPARGYQGGYLVGFVMLGVVAMRIIILYQAQAPLGTAILFLTAYGLLYATEPLLRNRIRWHRFLYFPIQTGLVLALTNLRPFTDVSNLLYIPLCVQVVHSLSRRAAIAWIILYTALLSATLILGMAWLEGLAVLLLYLAVCGFIISYDFFYERTQADQAESQLLLADLQAAHEKLKEYADQAEDLAGARERTRLAREIHDSVSQVIFSISLTARSTRLLLDRDPARVPEQLDRLQEMTAGALSQLRSLIAELRPPQKI